MQSPLRPDWRLPRRWDRVWEDRPAFFWPNCPCCASGAKMYSLGGETGLGAAVVVTMFVTADKTDMSAETTAAVTTANLTGVRTREASIANPSTAGYFTGGTTGATNETCTPIATTEKLTFSSDVTASLTTATLSEARWTPAALSERSTKGYVCGGSTTTTGNPGVIGRVTAEIFTFSSETFAASTSAVLSTARFAVSAMSEGTSKGYFAGGAANDSFPGGWRVVADKLTFSTDTTAATTTANISLKRGSLIAGGNGSTKGYWAGGATNAIFNHAGTTTDKLTFSSDTTAVLTSASFDKEGGSSGSDGNKLIGLGGVNSSAVQVATGIKMTFATDVVANLSGGASLSVARSMLAGLSTVAL